MQFRRPAARPAAAAPSCHSGGGASVIAAIGLVVVAANLLVGLYAMPRFALPSRFARDDATSSAAGAGRRPRRGASAALAAAAAAAPISPAAAAASSAATARSAAFASMFPAAVSAAANDFVTHEACFAQSDEAETCFYKGPLCYDGDKVVVSGATRRGTDARNSMCYDFRHFVASQSCGYNGPHKRDNLPEDATLPFVQDELPAFVNGANVHKWGPIGREVAYREVDEDFLRHPEAHNSTILWLDEGLYIGGMHHSWIDHTWHFAAAAMSLFDIKRYNRTGRQDDAHSLSTAGAWAAPPIKYMLWAGNYRNVKGPHELRTWIANLLRMLVQNGTSVLWNSVWKDEMGVGAAPSRLVCSRAGAVLGLKPRFFNSIGDAHAFRLMAYRFAGVTARAKDEWPPRQITLITRIGSRALENLGEVVPVLNATGLKLHWVQEMGALTFAEQVDVMAHTGILVAIHGAGLTNVMFMPAHAVVIEVFPYVMYASMYRDLAASAGLYYYRVQSLKPPNTNGAAALLYEAPFVDNCDGEKRHISSPAAFLDYECNWRSKSSPLVLDLEQLRYTIALALDDIGCRESYCEIGYEHVNMKKWAAAGGQ